MAGSATATPDILHKDGALKVSHVKAIGDEGVVEAFVSGIGNRDSVGDIIVSGAFDKSLARRNPKGCFSHSWDIPVSKTLEIYEVKAGDPRLPDKMKAAGIGGLYVKTLFNLNTQRGREAYEDVKFFGEEAEFSIGYVVIDSEYSKELGATLLKEIELFEYSFVLFGANPLTSLVSIKRAAGGKMKIRVSGIEDEAVKAAVEAALKTAVQAVEGEDVEVEIVNNGDHSQDEFEAAAGDAAKDDEDEEEATKEGEEKPASETPAVTSEETAEGGEKTAAGDLEKKVVPGSLEQRFSAIYDALRAKYSERNEYAWPVATFDDSVVYTVETWSEEDGYKAEQFRAEYTFADGTVTLGEPEPVEVVEVVIAKEANKALLKKSPDIIMSGYPNGVNGTLTTSGTGNYSFYLSTSTTVNGKSFFAEGNTGGVSLEFVPAAEHAEVKAGRVLSKANQGKLKAAAEAIQEVLDSAGSTEEGDDTDEKVDQRAEVTATLKEKGFTEEEIQKLLTETIPAILDAEKAAAGEVTTLPVTDEAKTSDAGEGGEGEAEKGGGTPADEAAAGTDEGETAPEGAAGDTDDETGEKGAKTGDTEEKVALDAVALAEIEMALADSVL